MKNTIFLFILIVLVACQPTEEPDSLIGQAVIAQRANKVSQWKAALVTFGEDINDAETILHRGFNRKYEKVVQKNQPFALILDIVDWEGKLNLLLKVSEKDVRYYQISDSLPVKEVYIHANGDLNAANEMASSIEFPCQIIIFE